MFEIIYAVTLVIFGLGYTANSFRKGAEEKDNDRATKVVNDVEQKTGFRFQVNAIKGFIEFIAITMMLLPVINTILLVYSITKGYQMAKTRKEKK